jgi:ABC-type spermidine/putrescine transport system permease subunit II
VRREYVIGGGLMAAFFFGLFYWAINYTWTERVRHEIMGYSYYETITRTIDPAIQALCLVAAIISLIVMVYGVLSRE